MWGKPNYQIVCKLQNLEGTGYYDEIIPRYGEPGTQTSITAPEIKGFTLTSEDFDQIVIDSNPETVQEIIITSYNRNKYTISFFAPGYEDAMDSIEAVYQKIIKLPDCTFTNPDVSKVFAGWAIDAAETQVIYLNDDEIEVTGDLNLYAMWMDKGKSRYKVTHHFQNIGGEGYTENEELAQELWGYDGALTEAEAHDDVDGFTAESFAQIKIEQNTEVKIKYERKICTISFSHNDECTGKMADETAWYQEKKALTDCSFTNPDTTKKFAGWSYTCPKTDQIKYLNDEVI